MLRARQNWAHYGEKNSKYFFGLEKKNYKKKNRYQIRDAKDSLVSGAKEILKVTGRIL